MAMQSKYSKQWFEDRSLFVRNLQRIFNQVDDSEVRRITLQKGDMLFSEGEELKHLYILMEGTVRLFKENPETGREFQVDRLDRGTIFGILAFTTGDPSQTTARAESAGEIIKVEKANFDNLLIDHPKLQRHFYQLIMANLVDRYSGNIKLRVTLESLNEKLEQDRNELQEAYRDLEKAQSRLIHQEKMAILGQLVAGFAHEINNPASALMSSAENVVEEIYELIIHSQPDLSREVQVAIFEAGLKGEPVETQQLRIRMQEISKKVADISRPKLRKLAQLPDDILKLFKANIDQDMYLDSCIRLFEIGRMLKNINSASERITDLVHSLKSYSQQDGKEIDNIDITNGLKETLQLLNNRVKYMDLVLNLSDIPRIKANAGALNQVWTNIIINACDAMDKQGKLEISTDVVDTEVKVSFADNGPGIPDKIKDRIFEANFTTKRQRTQFGLGLGLAISKEIIQNHGGRIEVSDNKPEGTVFSVYLPVS